MVKCQINGRPEFRGGRWVGGIRKGIISNGEPRVDSEGSRGVKVRVGKAWQSATMVGATMVEKGRHTLFGVGVGREGLNGGVGLGEE